jgi:peptidoglycan hydrolase-like protein with peptidoglycan-binding domain
MNWNIVQILMGSVPYLKSAWDEAVSNDDFVTKITKEAPIVAQALGGIGVALFPGVAPALQLVAGMVGAFDPDVTKWLQGSLNVLVTPSPALTVDGIYGPKTQAAVKAFQTSEGLSVDGIAGQITQAAISAVLAKKPKL